MTKIDADKLISLLLEHAKMADVVTKSEISEKDYQTASYFAGTHGGLLKAIELVVKMKNEAEDKKQST
jgi:hypothetical protein